MDFSAYIFNVSLNNSKKVKTSFCNLETYYTLFCTEVFNSSSVFRAQKLWTEFQKYLVEIADWLCVLFVAHDEVWRGWEADGVSVLRQPDQTGVLPGRCEHDSEHG